MFDLGIWGVFLRFENDMPLQVFAFLLIFFKGDRKKAVTINDFRIKKNEDWRGIL